MKKIISEKNQKAWLSFWSLALSLIASNWSHAQTPVEPYPNRPVKVLVGYGPGGTEDLTVRLVAKRD
jgi:tripartite-type tricarboxylate transporter receptor subunit TctC